MSGESQVICTQLLQQPLSGFNIRLCHSIIWQNGSLSGEMPKVLAAQRISNAPA
jgi:hypothetical protein